MDFSQHQPFRGCTAGRYKLKTVSPSLLNWSACAQYLRIGISFSMRHDAGMIETAALWETEEHSIMKNIFSVCHS